MTDRPTSALAFALENRVLIDGCLCIVKEQRMLQTTLQIAEPLLPPLQKQLNPDVQHIGPADQALPFALPPFVAWFVAWPPFLGGGSRVGPVG